MHDVYDCAFRETPRFGAGGWTAVFHHEGPKHTKKSRPKHGIIRNYATLRELRAFVVKKIDAPPTPDRCDDPQAGTQGA
jgi:hypothetical protein